MTGDPTVDIAGRKVGRGHPAYIIAELSANHGQRFDDAVELVRAAKRAGADAVKLQTYTPDTITIDSDAEPFRHAAGSLWEGKTLYDLYSEAYMPWEWQPKLKSVAEGLGLHLFSSPFDETAVDFLEGMHVPAYKVASFEIVDLPLVEKIARTGKPMIVSTGMATLPEIEDAVRAARGAGAREIALLKCNSAYPAPAGEMNLRTIPDMMNRFGVPVGISDHTLGISVPAAAVSLGACIVEKHFTLSRKTRTPDAEFSLEPEEFQAMVEAVRTVEAALGDVRYEPTPKEAASRKFRPSLFVVKDIRKGEVFTEENVKSIRPGNGLPPKYIGEVLGRKASRDAARGTPVTRDLLA